MAVHYCSAKQEVKAENNGQNSIRYKQKKTHD